MNTLGKILVVLNFVFALVVAAFLSVKFATETNWKNGENKLREELDVSYKANKALQETAGTSLNQLSVAKGELQIKMQDLALKQAEWTVLEAGLQKSFKDAESRGKLAELHNDHSVTAMERMKKEVDALKDQVADREGRVLALHVKLKDSQDLAMMLDRDLKFSQDRNQNLIRRNQELEVAVAEMLAPNKGEAVGALAKDPMAPNPPPKYIKGTVEQVDKTDKGLVKVTLGSDHGLKAGHTLEVYRRSPSAEYVGLIRIQEVYHHTSVARLIRAPGSAPREMREGDEVSSVLSPR